MKYILVLLSLALVIIAQPIGNEYYDDNYYYIDVDDGGIDTGEGDYVSSMESFRVSSYFSKIFEKWERCDALAWKIYEDCRFTAWVTCWLLKKEAFLKCLYEKTIITTSTTTTTTEPITIEPTTSDVTTTDATTADATTSDSTTADANTADATSDDATTAYATTSDSTTSDAATTL